MAMMTREFRTRPRNRIVASGEMADRVRDFAWSTTPLGPIATWSPRLCGAVEIMLAAPQMAALVIGPERILLYNDAGARQMGTRHPHPLGLPVMQAFPQQTARGGERLDRVFAGESLHVPAQPLGSVYRGLPQDFDAYLTSIRGDGGEVIAVQILGVAAASRQRAELALRDSEAREALLARLRPALRSISDAGEMRLTALRLLGQQLGLERLYYLAVERDADGNRAHVIEQGYQRDPSGVEIGGRHSLALCDGWMSDKFARGEVIAVADVETDPELRDDERDALRGSGLAAFIIVPLLHDGEYTSGIAAHHVTPHAWSDAERDTIREVAACVTTAIEREDAQAALRASEQKYQALFDAIDEGFCIVEKLDRASGEPSDYRYLEANPAFMQHTGVLYPIGMTIRQLVPGVEDDLLGTYDQVLRTGRSARFETYAASLDLWVEVLVLPALGAGRLAVIFNDIGLRKRSEIALRQGEERQTFLLKLSDSLRSLADPLAIQDAAMSHIASHFAVAMAGFVAFDADDEHGTTGQAHARSYPLPGGDAQLPHLGSAVIDVLTAGQVFAFEARSDPRLAADRQAYKALGIRSGVAVPLTKRGQLALALVVYDTQPRRWTDADLRLLQDAAERARDAIERARAEAALRENEAWLACQKDALQAALDGTPLVSSLDKLSRAAAELIGDGAVCAFYMLDADAQVLRHVVGMAPAFGDPVAAADIAPDSFACELPLFISQPVITPDVRDDPRWRGWLPRPDESGVRAIWSLPVTTATSKAVGTLAVYSAHPRTPTSRELEILARVRRTAAVLISRHQEGRDRAAAETALRQSEERLRQFGEASQDILWIRDAATLQLVYLTPAFERTYGLSREAALAGDNYRNWQDLIVPEDRAHAARSIARIGAGEAVTFEYRIRRPSDGTVRWLRDTDFPITDDTGRIVLIGGIGHDFTDAREAELRLKVLVEGMPQLVWRARHGGEWTWASPQWAAYTGQDAWRYSHYGWQDVIHPADLAAVREAWSHAAEQGGFEVEHRIGQAGGGDYRWFQTRAAPVRDHTGTIIEWLGTSTDVHDLRELQERQEVLVAELQHRTRNLLAVVQSMADKTAQASDDFSTFCEEFRGRLEALGRVQGLLSRLNDHDRVTFDQLIATEIAATGSTDRVTLNGPVGIRLRSSMVQTLAMALHELATNAIKYGALGDGAGRLEISWRLETSCAQDEPWLCVEWRENGVTMPSDKRKLDHSGMGRELIERALPYQLGARTSYILGPDGVRCTIAVPISASTQ